MNKPLTTPADCRESDNEWQEKTLQPFLQRAPERLPQFTSLSGTTVKRLYTPADVTCARAGPEPNNARTATIRPTRMLSSFASVICMRLYCLNTALTGALRSP